MKAPPFSLKQLLLSVTLVAVGLAMLVVVVNWRLAPEDWSFRIHRLVRIVSWRGAANDGLRILLWFIGGAMIGAGLFTPFGRARRGVLIGLALQGGLLVLLYALALFMLSD